VRRHFPTPAGPATLALLIGATLLARSQLDQGFLAAVVAGFDLVVHEAGHPVFGLLGRRFLMFLGGALGQLTPPLAAAAIFLKRRQPGAFATAVVWLGFNLVEIGTYAADGEARLLPLLAADADAHDWWNMLGMLGLRHRAEPIGRLVQALGWALQAAGPTWLLARWLAPRVADEAGRAGEGEG
jgi:hypothetical protein